MMAQNGDRRVLQGRKVEVDQISGQLVDHVDAFRGWEVLQQGREVKEVGNSTDGRWRIRAIRGARVVLGSAAQSDRFDFKPAPG